MSSADRRHAIEVARRLVAASAARRRSRGAAR